MGDETEAHANVKQVLPFLRVSEMEHSVRYYVEGLGFAMKHQWIVDEKLRWCWLTLGGAALMLQEESPRKEHDPSIPGRKVGDGVALCFQCEDALAISPQTVSRAIQASEPQVGNSMWVTTLSDPDGYRLEFASITDVAEETKLSDLHA